MSHLTVLRPIESSARTEKLRELLDHILSFKGLSDLFFRWKAEQREWDLTIRQNRTLSAVDITSGIPRDWGILEEFFPIAKRVTDLHEVDDFCKFTATDGTVKARFRASLTKNMLGWEMVLRVLPTSIPTWGEALLPQSFVEHFSSGLAEGLVLIAGPTGMGKTTSMAALVAERCRRKAQKVVTIEDPVEYLYPLDTGSEFSYRQVGLHTKNFASGLRAAMRMSPDIIVVGEIRDWEAATVALSAGMSGHVVVATIHGDYAAQVPQRLNSFLNQHGSEMGGAPGRAMIASTLKLVLAQKLLYSQRHCRLIAVHEVMNTTTGIAAKIRNGDFFTLAQDIESGRSRGMFPFEESTRQRVNAGLLEA